MANSSDVLKAIERGHIQQAEINATMVGEISAIKNDLLDMREAQGIINTKVLGYLENDSKTSEKGVVNRLRDVEKKIKEFDVKSKVVVLLFLAIGFLVSFWDKIMGIKH
jgi:uncharacterized protein YwgA